MRPLGPDEALMRHVSERNSQIAQSRKSTSPRPWTQNPVPLVWPKLAQLSGVELLIKPEPSEP